MKFARTIRFDKSDLNIFPVAAEEGELALVGSSTYNTIVVGKTISKTTPFNAAPGDVWEFSGDYATQTAITDATQYEIGSVVYMTLLGTPTVSSGSIFAGMQIYNGTTKVGEITEVPAFAWPNVSVTSITCSLTEVVPVSTTLTFKAGSIFLSGDYSASIERGMRAKVTSGFAAGNIVDVITATYDANSRTTQVVYDASTNSNHLGTDGNIISFNGASDSVIVQGLFAILSSVYSGETAEEIIRECVNCIVGTVEF